MSLSMKKICVSVVLLSSFLCIEGCNYYYLASPKTPTNCTVGGTNVTLSCGVIAPSDPSFDILWFRSSEPAGSSGTIVNGSRTQFDALDNFPRRAFQSLVITNFSEPDSGYYWCQIMVSNCSDSSELMRSQEAHLGGGNLNNMCTEEDFTEIHRAGACAETVDFQGCSLVSFPVASLTPSSNIETSITSSTVAIAESTTTAYPSPTATQNSTAMSPVDNTAVTITLLNTLAAVTTTPSDGSPVDFLKENYEYIVVGGGAFVGGLFCAVIGSICVCICRRRKKQAKFKTQLRNTHGTNKSLVGNNKTVDSAGSLSPKLHTNTTSPNNIELDILDAEDVTVETIPQQSTEKSHARENMYEEGKEASLSLPFSARNQPSSAHCYSLPLDVLPKESAINSEENVEQTEKVPQKSSEAKKSKQTNYAEPITGKFINRNVYDTVCESEDPTTETSKFHVYITPLDAVIPKPKTVSENHDQMPTTTYPTPPPGGKESKVQPKKVPLLPPTKKKSASNEEQIYSQLDHTRTKPAAVTADTEYHYYNSIQVVDSSGQATATTEHDTEDPGTKTHYYHSLEAVNTNGRSSNEALQSRKNQNDETHHYHELEAVDTKGSSRAARNTSESSKHHYHTLEDQSVNKGSSRAARNTSESSKHHYHTLEDQSVNKGSSRAARNASKSNKHHYHTLEEGAPDQSVTKKQESPKEHFYHSLELLSPPVSHTGSPSSTSSGFRLRGDDSEVHYYHSLECVLEPDHKMASPHRLEKPRKLTKSLGTPV